MFSRAFSSQVQPVEIARKLAKEMDAHRTTSVARVYVPNQYTVWLGTEDRERLEGYERSLEQELSAYLLEHARRHDYALLTRPEVKLETDDRLRLGEFGIQTRLVKPRAAPGRGARAGRAGAHDGLLGAAQAAEVATRRPEADRPPHVRPRRSSRSTTAATSSTGRSPCSAARASATACSPIPTSRASHAELKRGQSGDWSISDLGSTNGVKVNGRQVDSARLTPGDQIQIGTTYFTFDIEA